MKYWYYNSRQLHVQPSESRNATNHIIAGMNSLNELLIIGAEAIQ